MSILVPGVGFAGQRAIVGPTTEYISLGPVPVDSWIDRVELLLNISGATGTVGMSVAVAAVRSQGKTANVLQAGESFVNESEANAEGVRAVQLFASVQLAAVFRLYPGYYVQSGPVWVLIALAGDPDPATFCIAASVKTLRRVEVRGP